MVSDRTVGALLNLNHAIHEEEGVAVGEERLRG
jgi:hypothetical protein